MVGYGHVYQSRYKSFPVESDEYFYQVVRYTERNALRAKLVSNGMVDAHFRSEPQRGKPR